MKYNIIGWSYAYENAVHIILEADNGKTISRTYERKGCFYNFMQRYGLFDKAIDIALKVWE